MIYTWLIATLFASPLLAMPKNIISCGGIMASARPRPPLWTKEQITKVTPGVVLREKRSFAVLVRAAAYGATMTEEQADELATFLESPFCHDFETRARSKRHFHRTGGEEDLATSLGAPEFVLYALANYLEAQPEQSPHRIINAIIRWLEYGVPQEGDDFNYMGMFHLICEMVLRAGPERLAEFFLALARSQLTPHLVEHHKALQSLQSLLAAARQAPPKLRPRVENVLLVRDDRPRRAE